MFLELKNTTFQSITIKILHFVTPLVIRQNLPKRNKKTIILYLIFICVLSYFLNLILDTYDKKLKITKMCKRLLQFLNKHFLSD